MTDGASIRAGRTKSCGCLTRFRGTNRLRGKEHKTATFRIWGGIKQRCTNPNHKKFHLYGGKGISICDRWLDYLNFLADMGERPPGMSIDRIDGTKGYSPENCRWATPKMQGNNTAANRVLTVGHRSQTVAQWSDESAVTIPVATKFNWRGGDTWAATQGLLSSLEDEQQ